MKKYLLKLFVCFLFAIAFFASFKTAKAYIPGDQPCTTTTVNTACTQVEGFKTICINSFCAYVSNKNYLNKFQEEIQNCADTGSMSMECYINGTVDIDNSVSEETTGQFGMLDTISISLTRMMAGPLDSTQNYTSADSGQPNYKLGGAIGTMASLTSKLYLNPPASGAEYLADIGKNIGLVKPVYAQGVGFQGFRPTLPLWKASRNLAYIFFILIFLFIGFAIMFRIKISAQTVVTIQNSIPKIIIAMILVTFSYAIVGLLIDIIYVIINVVIAAIGTPILKDIKQTQLEYTNLNIFDAFATLFGSGAVALYSTEAGIALTGLTTVIGTAFGGIIGFAAGLALPLAILAAIVLINLFRIFFSLLGCYISIVLALIIGPIQIALGVLPNSKGGFKTWINNLIGNIMVFPAVAMVILIASIIVKEGSGPTWRPPLLQMGGSSITAFIALGIIMILPTVPGVVKKAFKVEDQHYGTAIGEALRAPFAVAGGVSTAYKGAKGIGENLRTWGDKLRGDQEKLPPSAAAGSEGDRGPGNQIPDTPATASLPTGGSVRRVTPQANNAPAVPPTNTPGMVSGADTGQT